MFVFTRVLRVFYVALVLLSFRPSKKRRKTRAFWGPEAPEPRRIREILNNHLLEFRSEVLSAT